MLLCLDRSETSQLVAPALLYSCSSDEMIHLKPEAMSLPV